MPLAEVGRSPFGDLGEDVAALEGAQREKHQLVAERVHEHHREGDPRSEEEGPLPSLPRSVPISPAAAEMEAQIDEPQGETAVDVGPQPEEHREHDERPAAPASLRHLDQPYQPGKRQQPQGEGSVSPQRAHRQDRQQGEARGPPSLPREAPGQPKQQHHQHHADHRAEHPKPEPAPRSIHQAVEDFG